MRPGRSAAMRPGRSAAMRLLPCVCCHASAAMRLLPCVLRGLLPRVLGGLLPRVCCHASAAMRLLTRFLKFDPTHKPKRTFCESQWRGVACFCHSTAKPIWVGLRDRQQGSDAIHLLALLL
eukprot:3921343-Lingulodinium_polyedra.AAC.1